MRTSTTSTKSLFTLRPRNQKGSRGGKCPICAHWALLNTAGGLRWSSGCGRRPEPPWQPGPSSKATAQRTAYVQDICPLIRPLSGYPRLLWSGHSSPREAERAMRVPISNVSNKTEASHNTPNSQALGKDFGCAKFRDKGYVICVKASTESWALRGYCTMCPFFQISQPSISWPHFFQMTILGLR